MTRRNAPALIDPRNALRSIADKQLGDINPYDLLARIESLEHTISQMSDDDARNLPISFPQEIMRASPLILTTSNVKGSVTPTNITSTSGTTVANSNIGPLLLGIPYVIVAYAEMDMNAPAGQSIIAVSRIGSSGANVDGTRTATVGGERRGSAVSFLVTMGAGSSVNVAARARVTGGTGTINDAMSWGIAFPLGAMLEM